MSYDDIDYFRRSAVTLGRSEKTGRDVVLPYELRRTHLHMIGDSRKGKSKSLEHMARQDIVNGQGVCVLDPHGVLYNNLVRWLAANPILTEERTIHLIDPSSESHAVGFNPFAPTTKTTRTGRVEGFVDAIGKVWGQDMSETPLIKTNLRLISHVLDLHGLSPVEAPLLSTWSAKNFREYLTANLDRQVFHLLWAEVNTDNPKQFREDMKSFNRRLLELLVSPVLERIYCQTKRSIDWYRCMEEGHIVLVNLVPTGDFAHENARALGTMILNSIYKAALARTPDESRPFYVYVDEAYEYLTDDAEKMLVQTAKFGCHLVLAHHFLQQLRSRGDNIFWGVMHGAQTKVVFGLGYDDALQLVNRLFAERIDPNRVKHVLDRPTAVGQKPVTLRGSSGSHYEGRIDSPDVVSSSETQISEDVTHSTEGRIRPTGPSYVSADTSSESWQEAYQTIYELWPGATYALAGC